MKHKRLCEEGFGEKGNYTIILPIDQGVEHGPVDAFYNTDHPEMLDIDYQVDFIAELLHEGLVGATALPKRTANLLCKKYPHLSKDVILKLNHGNNLNQDLEPSQAVYSSSQEAANMGGIGFTIYPGSPKQNDMIDWFGRIQICKPDNVKSILWSYPRGNFKRGSTMYFAESNRVIMHAAYMAAQLEPDVIKVKMPTDADDLSNIVKAACGIPVVFSGGRYTDPQHMLLYAERIAKAGGYGMIVGRNIFQRKPDAAKNLLRDIHKIFRES